MRILAAGGEGDFTIARYRSSGDLDASFGQGGTLANVFGSTIGAARAIALTPDGNILVAGHRDHDVSLVQLTAAGALDDGFGDGGTVVTQVSTGNWDEAQALAIEEDGRLVTAGWVYEGASSAGDFAVLRYMPDGQLDSSFGGSGMVVTKVAEGSKADQATAVALQVDDRVPTVRVVVAGYASDSNSDFAIARYWR
jgi:uncharacterized delta-60 repeat protein